MVGEVIVDVDEIVDGIRVDSVNGDVVLGEVVRLFIISVLFEIGCPSKVLFWPKKLCSLDGVIKEVEDDDPRIEFKRGALEDESNDEIVD